MMLGVMQDVSLNMERFIYISVKDRLKFVIGCGPQHQRDSFHN